MQICLNYSKSYRLRSNQDIIVGLLVEKQVWLLYNHIMKAKDFKKEDYVLLAKLAQQTERYV